MTISGFGGMGKTYLAEEAGRWLLRTGMFARVCLVGYANFQGIDAVSYAVSVLATVLETNLIDAAAVTSALADQSVLVILDNLESLDAEQLVSLLDAAKEWSEVGESRVLLTTRTPDLHHPDYPNYPIAIGRRSRHVSLQLEGLQPDDAVNYFQSLLKLPPAPRLDLPFRNDLLALFDLVQRLPLAIGLLAAQLKDRQVLDVRKELEELMAQSPDNPLLASLNLSINRLASEVQEWIKRLGVFQGGAWEPQILRITEIEEPEWHKLKVQIEASGLIQVESLGGAPFFKFHPTFAPAMWSRLTDAEQQELLIRHREYYFQLSGYLYFEDQKDNPFVVRAVAQKELQNLLLAVYGSIAENEKFASKFITSVNRFLGYFGLNKERKSLVRYGQYIQSEIGSEEWFMKKSRLGDQMWSVGCYAEAETVFQEILDGLWFNPSYQRCLALGKLAQCHESTGQPEQAIAGYLQELEELGKLEQNISVKRETSTVYTDLGNVLTDVGNYNQARKFYEVSIEKAQNIQDIRMEAIAGAQIGYLALAQNNFTDAVQRYQEALTIFHQLDEPPMEAITWHQLGMVFEELHQWESAEQAYRKSCQINEVLNNLTGAAKTWNQLAFISHNTGKIKEAEEWYRKAINAGRLIDDVIGVSIRLNNLANLLQQFGDRLNEAQSLAEEALALMKTINPSAVEIWMTYNVLAEISDKQGNPAKAKEYRRLSRTTRANFAGTEYELRQHAQLIDGVARAVNDAEVRQQLESEMENAPSEWQNLNAAIRQILNGQRNEDILCEGLDAIDSQIVLAILGQVKR